MTMAKMEGPKKAAEAAPELAAKIHQERAELANTVSALAAKADVKTRVTDQVAGAKEQVADQVTTAKDKVADQVATAKGKVADQVATVKEAAAELTHEVGYQADQVASEAS